MNNSLSVLRKDMISKRLPKDIVDYVYILLHRSITLKLINEYNTKLKKSVCYCYVNSKYCHGHCIFITELWKNGFSFNYRYKHWFTIYVSRNIYNIRFLKKCNAMVPLNY